MQQPQRSSSPTSASMVNRRLPKQSEGSVPARGRASHCRRPAESRPIPSLFTPLKRLRVVFQPTETDHPVASRSHSGLSDDEQISEDAVLPAVDSNGKHPMGCFLKTIGSTTSSSSSSSAASSAVSGVVPRATSGILTDSSPSVVSCNRPLSASFSNTPTIVGVGRLGGDGVGHQRCIRRLTTGMVTLSAPASPPSRMGRASSMSLSPGYQSGDAGALLDPHGLMHASSSPYSPCPLLFSAGSPPALSACFGTPPSLGTAQQRCCYLRFPGDEEEDSSLAATSVLGSFCRIEGERSPLSPPNQLVSHCMVPREAEAEELEQVVALSGSSYNAQETKHSKSCVSVAPVSEPTGLGSRTSETAGQEVINGNVLTSDEAREKSPRHVGKRMRGLTPDTLSEQSQRRSVPLLSFPIALSKSETESALPREEEFSSGRVSTLQPEAEDDGAVLPMRSNGLTGVITGSCIINEKRLNLLTTPSPQYSRGKASGGRDGDSSLNAVEDTRSTCTPGTRCLLDSVESTWASQIRKPSAIADNGSTSTRKLQEAGEDKEKSPLCFQDLNPCSTANVAESFSGADRSGSPGVVSTGLTVNSPFLAVPHRSSVRESEDSVSPRVLKTPPAPLRRRTCYQRLLARAIYMGSRREVAKLLGILREGFGSSVSAENKKCLSEYPHQKPYVFGSDVSGKAKSEDMTADPNTCIVIRLPPLPVFANETRTLEGAATRFPVPQMQRDRIRVRDMDPECCFEEERILPLLAAARLCHAGVLHALLEGGAVVNSVNAAGQNALHLVFLQPIPSSLHQSAQGSVGEEIEQKYNQYSGSSRHESSIPRAWVALQHFFETLDAPSEGEAHSAELDNVKENRDPYEGRTTPKAVQRTRCGSYGLRPRRNSPLAFPELSESGAEGSRYNNSRENSSSVQDAENGFSSYRHPDSSAVLICADILLQHGIDSERVDVHGKTPKDYAMSFGLPPGHSFFTALEKAREQHRQQNSLSQSPLCSPLFNAVTPQQESPSEVQEDAGEKDAVSVMIRTPSPPRCRRLASAHNLRDGVTALSEGWLQYIV